MIQHTYHEADSGDDAYHVYKAGNLSLEYIPRLQAAAIHIRPPAGSAQDGGWANVAEAVQARTNRFKPDNRVASSGKRLGYNSVTPAQFTGLVLSLAAEPAVISTKDAQEMLQAHWRESVHPRADSGAASVPFFQLGAGDLTQDDATRTYQFHTSPAVLPLIGVEHLSEESVFAADEPGKNALITHIRIPVGHGSDAYKRLAAVLQKHDVAYHYDEHPATMAQAKPPMIGVSVEADIGRAAGLVKEAGYAVPQEMVDALQTLAQSRDASMFSTPLTHTQQVKGVSAWANRGRPQEV